MFEVRLPSLSLSAKIALLSATALPNPIHALDTSAYNSSRHTRSPYSLYLSMTVSSSTLYYHPQPNNLQPHLDHHPLNP
ncbi:hypothetical protein VTJ04DRAFT_7979 [Mycothermus thermophilus]|uniref:uncharacterized protein n=1 Tax=Humicola insolens TaxID=85995 RepID=UPI0037448783